MFLYIIIITIIIIIILLSVDRLNDTLTHPLKVLGT
jgi:hypothetical protein